MEDLDASEARELLSVQHFCDDASPKDWQILEKPIGAFNFEQGLVDAGGNNSGLIVSIHFYRSPDTKLITLKMSIFAHKRRQPRCRVYQLDIKTKSYKPDNWHDEAHVHFGKNNRLPVDGWRDWTSFADALNYFTSQTNIEFRPPLDDPEHLRLAP